MTSTPKCGEQVDAFARALGVTLVITLTEEQPLRPEWFAADAVAGGGDRAAAAGGGYVVNRFVPVPNYEPPSIEQVGCAVFVVRCMQARSVRGDVGERGRRRESGPRTDRQQRRTRGTSSVQQSLLSLSCEDDAERARSETGAHSRASTHE